MSEEVGAKRWYAVHTYSDMKTKLKFRKSRIYEYDRANFRVVIPEEEETQVKDGKAKKLVKNIPRLRAS